MLKTTKSLILKAVKEISGDFDGFYFDKGIRYIEDRREQIVLSNDKVSFWGDELSIQDLVNNGLIRIEGNTLYLRFHYKEDFIEIGKIPQEEAVIISLM